MFKFQKLKVWNKAVAYSILLFKISKRIPKEYRYTHGSQLDNATLSITNNIAEGSGRHGKKESSHFFNISKGSVYETINILVILTKSEIISLSQDEKQTVYESAEEICKMLTGLIKS